MYGVPQAHVLQGGRVAKRWALYAADDGSGGVRSAPFTAGLAALFVRSEQRDAFVLPGRFAYARPPPGSFSHLDSLGAAAAPGARGLPLAPSTRVAADAASRTLDVAPRDGGWGLQLRFADLAELDVWRAALAAEVARVPLAAPLGRTFGGLVHTAVWARLARPGGDATLRAFYYGADARADELFNHLFSALGTVLGAAPAEPVVARAYTALLAAAAARPAARAVLLAFPLDEALLLAAPLAATGGAAALRGASAMRALEVRAAAFEGALGKLAAAADGEWGRRIAPALLRLLRFPPPAAAAGVAFEAEMQWFHETRTQRLRLPRLTAAALDGLLALDGAFCTRVFLQQAVDANDPTRLRAVLGDLPAGALKACYRESGGGGEDPIAAALVDEKMQDEESFTALVRAVLDAELVTDAFYAAFLRLALARGKVTTVQRFLEHVIFSDADAVCCVEAARHIVTLAPATVEALAVAVEAGTVDPRQEAVAIVLELALRFEHVDTAGAPAALRHLSTLRGWLASGAPTRATQLLLLFKDTGFPRFFADVCAPNEALMHDALPPEASAPLSNLFDAAAGGNAASAAWQDDLPLRGSSGGGGGKLSGAAAKDADPTTLNAPRRSPSRRCGSPCTKTSRRGCTPLTRRRVARRSARRSSWRSRARCSRGPAPTRSTARSRSRGCRSALRTRPRPSGSSRPTRVAACACRAC